MMRYDFSFRDSFGVLISKQILLIFGDEGSGKTEFLKSLVYQLFKERLVDKKDVLASYIDLNTVKDREFLTYTFDK